MKDVESRRNFCRPWILIPVLGLALGSAGCPKTPPPVMADSACKVKVKVVCIDDQKNANPDPVKVKKKEEIVVWVGPKDSVLQITFTNNPFPTPVSCPGGNFCASLLPPNGAEQDYPYTVSLTLAGTTTSSDPHLVVVP